MGTGLLQEEFLKEESLKVERCIVFLIIAGVIFHAFSKYAITGIDTSAFMIFFAMCFSGYLALKAAQEVICAIEDKKQTAYEAVKSNSYLVERHGVSPLAFNNNTKFSKYATSAYAKRYKTVY